MKKNRMMRLASVLLVLTLLSTSVISGTFAKYTTSVTSNDKARVAYWGFQASNSMDITKLFENAYDTTVASVDKADVIAPGTLGSQTFSFAWDETVSDGTGLIKVTGPEVAYQFTVDVVSSCDQLIKDNKNIQWKLDDGAWGTWDQMIADIKALSGDNSGSKRYEPNTLPAEFTAKDDVHTISWQWLFTDSTKTYTVNGESMTQDQYDTYMGNAATMDKCSIKITITATQID